LRRERRRRSEKRFKRRFFEKTKGRKGIEAGRYGRGKKRRRKGC
jgi:hypothetical protein